MKSAYKKLRSTYKNHTFWRDGPPYVFPFRLVQSANNEFVLKKTNLALTDQANIHNFKHKVFDKVFPIIHNQSKTKTRNAARFTNRG